MNGEAGHGDAVVSLAGAGGEGDIQSIGGGLGVAGQAGDYWRFTAASARYLLEKHFPPANLTIEPVGNLLASLNFLIGLAREEMETEKLNYQDKDFPCLICAKAIK